jgi:flagellar protein FliT
VEASDSIESPAPICAGWARVVSIVVELFQVTKQLYDLLDEPIPKEARDETIDMIRHLLGRRDELIEQLQPPYSDEEQELGMEIVMLNETIDQRLHGLKQQIYQDLKAMKQKKMANQNYLNPYQSLSVDGMFYDKKR